MQSLFSNVQLEILQLFTEDLPEKDLLIIKDILSAYRLRMATEAANKVVGGKGWSVEDFKKMIHTQNGDYTKEREGLYEGETLEGIMMKIKQLR